LVAVAHAWFGMEVARPGRVGFQLAPQVSHVDPEVVRLGLVLLTENRSDEL